MGFLCELAQILEPQANKIWLPNHNPALYAYEYVKSKNKV